MHIHRYISTSPFLTNSGLNRLTERVSGIAPMVAGVTTLTAYYVGSLKTVLALEEEEKLRWVLGSTYAPDALFRERNFSRSPLDIEVGPRLGIETPWSSNLVSALGAIGLSSIVRVERSRIYCLNLKDGVRAPNVQELQDIGALLGDRMLEEVYLEVPQSFPWNADVESVYELPLLSGGLPALTQFLKRESIGFKPMFLDYILEYFTKRVKRDPTNVELYQLAQLWSDHCRHLIFRGSFQIDGQSQRSTLFDLVKSTVGEESTHLLVAFHDNAAVVRGHGGFTFTPGNTVSGSPYKTTLQLTHATLKVETHNHPTLWESFHGAATGTGGEIRDRLGVGQGGLPVAGLACYYAGSVFIPEYPLSYEVSLADYGGLYEKPLDILIGASNGATRYGNEFGQPTILGVARSFEQSVGGIPYAYRKPIMVAGGVGIIDAVHTRKANLCPGLAVVQFGGPSLPIGLGGGSGSSVGAGTQNVQADFNSVQRGNGEMQNRVWSVIRSCVSLGSENLFLSITDLGAGGSCVAWAEIVDMLGGVFSISVSQTGDAILPAYVLFCNESQERMVAVIRPEDFTFFQGICERNRCPVKMVGEVGENNVFLLTDSKELPGEVVPIQFTPVNLHTDFMFADLPQLTVTCSTESRNLLPLSLPADLSVLQALKSVFSTVDVSSKEWLTRKGDRSVGGMVVRQQEVGPWQVPINNYSLTLDHPFGYTGSVLAIGEQPIKMLVNTEAGVRMSMVEAVTNIVWANIGQLENITLSATWQWPCGQSGEDARFYQAVQAASEFAKQLGVPIGVGKDSTSMTLATTKNGEPCVVRAPGTVQFVAHASTDDVRLSLTPDIKQPGESSLLFIDLASGKQRLGGSILSRIVGQVGNESPDIEDVALLRSAFACVQKMLKEGLILSGHDKSDGGLITTLCEMAFAGNCGLDIALPKTLGADTLALLFNEEAGVVIEYLPNKFGDILSVLKEFGLDHCCFVLGTTRVWKQVSVRHNAKRVLDVPMAELYSLWRQTSFQLSRLQATSEVVEMEERLTYNRTRPVARCSFVPKRTPPLFFSRAVKPLVAILREEGTNGQEELARSFFLAGFEPWDVHMTDLVEGRITLEDFKGLAFPGGFSFADVPESAKAWAAVWKFNVRLQEQLAQFLRRSDTFTLGVCNGAQVSMLLGLVPFPDLAMQWQPRFLGNTSGKFESRLVHVKILPSPSIFLSGMEDSVLPVIAAHGEGRFFCPEESLLEDIRVNVLAPLRFVDDLGVPTEDYPWNPNGSPKGITGVCSKDGRHLAFMEHPERMFRRVLWPYTPKGFERFKASPWLQMFQNARKWCDES